MRPTSSSIGESADGLGTVLDYKVRLENIGHNEA
jgi:hypothetical protein